MKPIDTAGRRLGMSTVIEKVRGRRGAPRARRPCKRGRGNRAIVAGGNSRSGNTTGCGCKSSRSKGRWSYRRANAEENTAIE